MPMLKLVLLDRDGVINHESENFVKTPSEWMAIDRSPEAIAELNAKGLIVAVCSNQSAIGRGVMTDEALQAVHRHMDAALHAAGAHVEQIYVCPHTPDEDCECRKPKPGLLRAAMADFDATPSQTCFVGDSLRDAEAALAADCEPILVLTGNGRRDEAAVRLLGVHRVHDDLAAAVRDIVK